MTAMDPQRESRPAEDDTIATAPRIVNGLTVRPREKVNLRRYGILLLPDIILLFVIVGIGMHRLLRYLDANTKRAAE